MGRMSAPPSTAPSTVARRVFTRPGAGYLAMTTSWPSGRGGAEGLDVSDRNKAILELEETVLIPTEKFIFISPEYNGSIPGVLKSLIDVSDIVKVKNIDYSEVPF